MRRALPEFLATAALICALSCRRADTASEQPRVVRASPPPLPCFTVDSGPIAFGKMSVSSVDQDVSGVQFSFEIHSGQLLGYVRDAAGEVPPRSPLQDLQFDSATDTLSFVYVDSPASKDFYRYHVTCDRLTGLARLFVTPHDSGRLVHDTLDRAAVITVP